MKCAEIHSVGSSIGIRISAHVLGATGLKLGDHVYVRLMDSGDIRVRPAKVSASASVDENEAVPAKPAMDEPW